MLHLECANVNAALDQETKKKTHTTGRKTFVHTRLPLPIVYITFVIFSDQKDYVNYRERKRIPSDV